MKKIIIVAAVIIIIILFFLLFYGPFREANPFCQKKWDTLMNENDLIQNVSCKNDNDCVPMDCGCRNKDFEKKVEKLNSYCRQPLYACIIPNGCQCVNNVCKEYDPYTYPNLP